MGTAPLRPLSLPPSARAAPSERIGIFGGTFDPPHCGHFAAARAVLDALDLDRLLVVVANDPWQKSPTRAITPAEDRFAMAQALCGELPGAEASRMEIDRGGPSYTVVTAEALVEEAAAAGKPAPEIFLVVGADLVPDLVTWERVDDLKSLVELAVVSRPGPPPESAGTVVERTAPSGWRVRWVDGPQVDVSSSAVRDVLERGGPLDHLVPAEVVRCIRRRNLYAVGR
jgi:nicotinate-nucleotide adenylyltransferase